MTVSPAFPGAGAAAGGSAVGAGVWIPGSRPRGVVSTTPTDGMVPGCGRAGR